MVGISSFPTNALTCEGHTYIPTTIQKSASLANFTNYFYVLNLDAVYTHRDMKYAYTYQHPHNYVGMKDGNHDTKRVRFHASYIPNIT